MWIILALPYYVISPTRAPIPQENDLIHFGESVQKAVKKEAQHYVPLLSESEPRSTETQNPTPNSTLAFHVWEILDVV